MYPTSGYNMGFHPIHRQEGEGVAEQLLSAYALNTWFREFSCVYNEQNSIIWRSSSSFRATFVFHPPAVALRIFQFLQQMKEAYREQIPWLCSLLYYDSTVHHEEGEGEEEQRMGTAYNWRLFHNLQWRRRKALFFFFFFNRLIWLRILLF